ncbi:MAG: DNA-protecting protein DprA [Acidimicrobiales bacterium]|nr:DNA-protecting protein DprA [Acidimicrobiales bacterium]
MSEEVVSQPLEHTAALVALACLPGVGPGSLRRWVQAQNATEAWELASSGRASKDEVLALSLQRNLTTNHKITEAARHIDPLALLERHRTLGIGVHILGTAGYPQRLAHDPSPPAVLFSNGDISALDAPMVAIVGTRNATRLGCDTAARLAGELSMAGVSVASGLALGIDGAAHSALVWANANGQPPAAPPSAPHDGQLGNGVDEGSDGGPGGGLASGIGRPVAVVAAGLDCRYPRAHRRLHDQIVERGVVLSEVPLGMGPSKWRFPARNRILAGLADALVVVESRSSGGSMLTVAEALRRDRPILAVPGHPTSPSSAGTLDLICDGATPLRDVEDVLVAIGMGGSSSRPLHERSSSDGEDLLGESQDEVASELLGVLAAGALTLSEVLSRVDSDRGLVAQALLELELSGKIVATGSWYELSTGAARASSRGARR